MLNGSGEAMVQGTAVIHSTRSGSSAGSTNCRAVGHAALGGVLLLGGPAGVGVGGLVARLLLFQLCEFGLHRVLGGVVAGVVLGGVVALHVLRVLGGGVAGGGRVVIRTASRARGVLRS